MGDVVLGGYVSINSVDRSAFCESWEPSWDLEIQESRTFDSNFVKKDAGLENHSFSVTFVDDTSYTIVQALDAIAGTKVAFELRYDDAAVGATNPKWTGNCVIPRAAPPATQGGIARFSVTFQVDGQATMAVA
ncbi:MAG: hypothetical protein ACYSUI_25605 [Planctomycetota bacterium]|jgi:hypothetical protein